MRILLAMSGGVDSTAAAYLLKQEHGTCEGCTLCLSPEGGKDAALAAADVACRLGLLHRTLDWREEFAACVMQPFAEAYAAGKTPNPCVLCNLHLKFGRLYDYAMSEGFSHLASGHYARIEKRDGHYRLLKARDTEKDQSYVLYRLREEMLPHLLFPLGEYRKSEVRAVAETAGFPSLAAAGESQDICFVPRGGYAATVARLLGKEVETGDFIDKDGNILGRHRGITAYTIGQHKGLGIALGRVRYVTAINAAARTVTLGDEADCYAERVVLPYLHYIDGQEHRTPYRAAVKLRYRQEEAPATVYPDGDGAVLVFDTPQRAPAAGQSAVLYDGDAVLGGGEIG